MKIILLLATLLYCASMSWGQSAQKTDSLLKLLSTAKEDSNKVLLYISVANELESNDAEKAKQYYRQAGELSKKINYDNGNYKQLVGMGSVYLVHGNYDSSLYYQEQSLAVAQKMNDSLNIGIALFNIGICYREKSDYTKAIDYCLQGRKIIEAKGQKAIELQVDDALQILYFNRSEYDKAIVFGEKAVALGRELHMPDFIAKALINLTLSYSEKKMYEKGNEALEEAFKIAAVSGDMRMQATILQNRAELAIKKSDYPLTIKYTEQSLALCRQIQMLDGEALSLRALAICYLQLGKHEQAMDYAQQALQIDRKNNYKREEAAVLRVMSAIAYASGDATKGYQYDDQSFKLIESLISDILSQQSSELEKKYETEQKETRIKQLEAEKKLHTTLMRQKNIINYSLLAGAATLLIIGLLAYRNYGHKQKLQRQHIHELETEKQLTATEAVLKGEEQERTRLAKDLHDGLGGMLSSIKYSMNTMKGNSIMTPENQQAFERSMDMLDSSIQEMRRVAHNMMPEALVKFGLDTALKDFCNDINQSGALQISYQSIEMEHAQMDQTIAITIYRIVQELINNTIKHAQARTAIVQVTKSNGHLAVTVEDDGKGFDTNLLNQARGIGWTNIKNRVEFLKGKLDVNSQKDKGTSVLIELSA